MNEAYWQVAALMVIHNEMQKKRQEPDPEVRVATTPVRNGMRFVVRKFGKLLVIVGCKLVHVGYPDVSSRYI